MGAEAKLHTRFADRLHIGLSQVFLAQMDEIAMLLDREAPVIVDDELTTVAFTYRLRSTNVLSQRRFVLVLDAQLHQLHAKRHKAFDPVRGIDDQVEWIELHENAAMPMTGVEGTAMSRGSSRPPQ